MRILHLEDSDADAELIESTISQEWPVCEFVRVLKRADFEKALLQGRYDIVLTDYSLPDFDGISALEMARVWCPDTPFIFLSGTIGEERAVEALKRGAMDYVLKDRPGRLIPALQQALARTAEAVRHRAAEARIHELASLLDKARDAIYVAGLDRKVTFWNASAAQLFGWSMTEAIGQDISSLLFKSSEANFEQAWSHVLDQGEWAGELLPRSRDGAVLTMESRWTLVADTDGQPSSVLFIDTDVTQRKRLECQLLRAQRLESVAALTGGLAHDLNNVLSPIIMATSVLQMQLKKPEDLQLLSTIESTAQHGSSLIRQLLAFGRGAEGERKEVQVGKLVENLEKLVRPSLGKTVELTTRCEEDLWPIQADVTQLNQVLINLCVNARDAMPNGGKIHIVLDKARLEAAETKPYPEIKPGPFLRIAVTDTGTGIPPEIIDRIFDPFFTTRATGKGTGLGLSTVSGIMKGHGGFVTVDSVVGKGTTFRLFFPAFASRPK